MDGGSQPGGVSGGVSRDEWLAAYLSASASVPPATDALTVLEFAEMLGIKRSYAHRRLTEMVRAGLAERTRKQIRRFGGSVGGCHLLWVPAYRLLKR